MKKNLFTRVVSLCMSALMLVSSFALCVSANSKDTTKSNLTDKTISEYADKLSTISYDDYVKTYFVDTVKILDKSVSLDLTKAWTYTSADGDIVITYANGEWKMTVGEQTYTTLKDAEAAGYSASDLCYVTTDYDGVESIYTPSTGSVTWEVDLESAIGTKEDTLWNISLDYYPVVAKETSVEREFYINGEAPFSEARSITLSKLWSSWQQDGETALTATYTPTKKESAEEICKEAVAIGMDAKVVDGNVVIAIPDVVTAEIAEFQDKYEIRYFSVDATENELRPTQEQTPEWVTYTFRDSEGFDHTTDKYTGSDFGFVLNTEKTDGKISFTLDGVNEPVALATLTLIPYVSGTSYEDYYNAIVKEVGAKKGDDVVKIEAEYTNRTSTNVVYPVEDRSSATTSPADTSRTVLNTIGTEKWQTAGQWVEYKFTVNDSGFYDIFTRFKQSYLDGIYVNRSLQIYTNYDSLEAYKAKEGQSAGYYDGLPFDEASRLRYNYGTDWQVTGLYTSTVEEDGTMSEDTHEIYFKAGVEYTLRLEVTLGSMSSMIMELETILDALNDDYLTILKLTGSSPDDYRDYKFSRLLPDTLVDMIKQANALDELSSFLKESAGVASTYSGICDKLVTLLKKMAYDEDEIAKNLDNFKSYVGSLGTFLTDAKTQPVQIDYLTIQSSEKEAPKGKANFFQSLWHEIKSFIQSFFRDYNSMGAMETSEDVETISVWLPYGRDQANVIRNMSTNDYTQESGVAVDLKLITAGTLLPSILAGMGPDVYLGLAQANVINYAIRGALENIETLEGFDEHITNFNDAAMTVLQIDDAYGDGHTYGLPETQEFPMMFIRYDILNDLDIEIPTTWADLLTVQAKLKAKNMEIGIINSYKTHLYQMGGDLWADNGMRINLDSTVGLEAFVTNSDLFTQYSFPYTYDAANRFRTGEMPIIIAQYTTLYNKLKVFATELDGCWTFVPIPGYEYTTEDGETYINNDSISTVTAVVMISGSEHKDSAWDYMKWYTGAQAQSDYANEMVAIIGDSAKHSTANREALASMPWTVEEYEEVQKQFDNLASVSNYPGYYYIDRYTGFAFLAAYNDDADPSDSMLKYINTINAEITRKRKEFGLETLDFDNGESNLATKRMMQAESAMALLVKNYNYDEKTGLIYDAEVAIANEKSSQLLQESKAFEEKLLTLWNGANIEIEKTFNGVTTTITKPSYYLFVNQQTNDAKDGGYALEDLNEQQLLYFVSVCLSDAADALDSY